MESLKNWLKMVTVQVLHNYHIKRRIKKFMNRFIEIIVDKCEE